MDRVYPLDGFNGVSMYVCMYVCMFNFFTGNSLMFLQALVQVLFGARMLLPYNFVPNRVLSLRNSFPSM